MLLSVVGPMSIGDPNKSRRVGIIKIIVTNCECYEQLASEFESHCCCKKEKKFLKTKSSISLFKMFTSIQMLAAKFDLVV